LRAVIDVGSNAVLLLVAERADGSWRPVHEESRVTGLGRGAKSTGVLAPESQRATLSVLAEFWNRAVAAGARRVVALATMAARLAINADEFLDAAARQSTPVAVLSGEDEARYGFLAVAQDPLFADDRRISVVDVGGHSTEIVTAHREPKGWDVLFRRSFAIGALGLREGPLQDPSPSAADLLRAVVAVDEALGMAYLPGQCGRIVTLGATGTNLVTIRDKATLWRPDRVHGSVLGFEEVSKAVSWMCGMDDAGRAAIVGIEPGREHTLHAGALILERCLQALGGPGCTVSVRGWRHAVLSDDGWFKPDQ
jgi:exopolyphosphatase/guanosine-5'-triphosphate,3'-diphosphate pyrophosphatase